ncbi:MAG: hypothetical protein RR162_00380 [Oscillospiraceae bacterium]
MWKELLLTLLQTVLVAAVPVLTTFAVKFMRAKSAQLASQVENETIQGYLTEITNAVSTAVSVTSQTYVDALKASGSFDKAEQLIALKKAKDAALSILSPAALAFVEKAYGNVYDYIEAKIEETVHIQKVATPLMISSVSETTNATSIAASTAAATAASIATTAIAQLNAEISAKTKE